MAGGLEYHWGNRRGVSLIWDMLESCRTHQVITGLMQDIPHGSFFTCSVVVEWVAHVHLSLRNSFLCLIYVEEAQTLIKYIPPTYCASSVKSQQLDD